VRLASAFVLTSLAASIPRPAHAAEGTEVATAFDDENPFDILIGVYYNFEARRAAIKREFSGLPDSTAPDGVIPIVKDLIYSQQRHTITPQIDVMFHGLQLTLALPVVLSDTREMEFDQRAEPCVFPGGTEPATCIDRTNSSTLIDGILPDGSDGRMGYDANDPTTNFSPDSATVFRGVNRSGLDQFHIGLTWGPMSQRRDDTKPNWVIGAELRLSVGQLMKFNRMSPDSETGVSPGVHEIRLHTELSKRTAWAEPFISFWWQAPIGVRGDNVADPNGSLFWDVGFGQETNSPQQRAGTLFGFEAIAYDNPKTKQSFSLRFQGRVEAHFEGKGYSEMWEAFSIGGDLATGGPLVVDPDPTNAANANISHPGVSIIENYLTFGGSLGFRAQIGERARFGATFEIANDQAHIISFTDAGDEKPGCSATVTTGCENPNDEVITPGTDEVDPLHQQRIDVVGRRYIVDETTNLQFMVAGTLMF
jgi:hypothetical protein